MCNVKQAAFGEGERMEIPFTGYVDLKELIRSYGLEHYTMVNLSIGYDEGIYLLFSARVPERISGMFVDTQANTEYRALCLWVDWQDGVLLGEEMLNFGVREMNFHFIQPIENDILLLGARTRMHKNGVPDQNAVFLTRQGKVKSCTCFGDGIQDCLVLRDGRIVTSYFDEGVFGNYGWDRPLGDSGLVVWNRDGEVQWRNTKHFIADCYAMNVDEQENLWYYYYCDFELVKTDFEADWVFRPEIQGSSSFLIMKSHRGIVMDNGYGNYDKLTLLRLLGSRLDRPEDVTMTYDGAAVALGKRCFRSSRAVVADGDGRLLFVDVV